jgi:hypothetical protein
MAADPAFSVFWEKVRRKLRSRVGEMLVEGWVPVRLGLAFILPACGAAQ